MRRRRFLRVAAMGSTFALAGCSNDADSDATDATTERTATTTTDETIATEPATTQNPPLSSTPTSDRADADSSPGETTAKTTIDEATTDDETTSTETASTQTTTDETTTDANAGTGGDRTAFVWAEQSLWQDERARENLFAYAGRHDFAVVVAHANANREDIGERLAKPLAAARHHGVEAWVNTGLLSRITPGTFINDAEARRIHLDRLGRAAETYAEYNPGGRLILWQEAPVGGQWVEGGAWNDQSLKNLRKHGPRVFTAQKRAIAEAAPDLDVGIFVHFPYIVDSKQPEVFAGLMDDLRANGVLPDFVFADFYRGWYEKDAGPETANRAVESLITNARKHTDGREVLYMGGAHTINPHHTPSKQSIRMDLRASTGVEADGLGWYSRTAYTTTKEGFDPFVPNITDPKRVPHTPRANTATFARDRYQYAYTALRETRAGYDPDEAFDLWLVGEGFSFYDHRLSMRTRSGEWAFVGDFDGYLAGTRPTRDGTPDTKRRVSIFRGLDRERFVPAGGDSTRKTHATTRHADLELGIETRAESTGARLDAVCVMPAGTGGYLTEPAAARAFDTRDDIDAFALGRKRVGAGLTPNDSLRVGVSVAGTARRPPVALAHPEHTDAIARLRAVENRVNFDPGERFDLWIEASGLDALSNPAERLSIPAGSGGDAGHTLADAGVAVSTAPGGAVAYGLDRTALLSRVGKHGIEIHDDSDGDPTLRAAYAMVYFGSRNFVPASEALETVANDREEARTYSVKHTKLG